MIFRIVTQAVLALSLLQIFPADAGVVEDYATLPDAPVRHAVSVSDVFPSYDHALPDAPEADHAPKKVDPTSVGVVTSAVSATVVDRKTGKVLYQKNADVPRSIGSITKLMTAHVFLQTNPDLDAEAQIQSDDVRYGGIQHVSIGDKVNVRDLLHASLVGSDNSATASLVRLSGMSLSDFVSKMNETAAKMGMQNTTFVDSTGLSSENRATVHDIVKLLNKTLENKTIRETTQLAQTSMVGASGRVYRMGSTNQLLSSFLNEDPYKIIGGKTGFLPEAGYCFGAVFEKNTEQQISVVVLGSKTEYGRFQDAKALASWAYKVYRWPTQQVSI